MCRSDGGECGLVTAGDGYPRSFGLESQCRGEADTAIAPEYDDCFSRKPHF
jgi:hypothetical protein